MDEEVIKNELWDNYKNISLTDAENIIKSNLNGCARNFVAIGFYLKDIRDNETYQKGGYESIWDFAQDKLQMAKSTVSRFMSINDKFSEGGNTPVLMGKYRDFGSGKLQEMLNLTDEQIESIDSKTTVKEIREIKRKPKASCDAQQIERVKGEVVKTVIDIQETVTNSTEIVNEELKNVTETMETVIESDEAEVISTSGQELEFVEVEIMQSESYDIFSLAKEILDRKQGQLKAWLRIGNPSADETISIEKAKIEVSALAVYITELDNIVNPIPVPEQPELPILKNNDQRKEFIDNYTSWPVWIDQIETGEKYFRYDLSKEIAIVVKVSKKHSYQSYKETKNIEYGAEQYYLLGIKTEWSQKGTKYIKDDTRTFYECNTNKSALVDYLKEFQKGDKHGKESTK